MTKNREDGENATPRPSIREMQGNIPESLTTPSIDPERIAALIDGRLSAAERETVLAELDASPEALEAYADAVAALGEEASAASSTGGGVSLELERGRRRFRTYAPTLAVAAALLIAVSVPMLRRTGGPDLEAPHALAALVQPSGDAVTVWQQPSWTELRGTTDALSARARAVRIGARIVDLGLLARVRDSSAARVALQVASLLDGIPAGGMAASAYRAFADPTTADLSDDALRRAESFAEQVAGTSEVRAGAWLEAARVAAVARDGSFFESSMSDAERTISSLRNVPQSMNSALAELTRLLGTEPRDWPAIENALSVILRELATG